MMAMVSQITSLTIVYSTVYSRTRSRKTSKLRVTGLCEENLPLTGEFPAQRASNAENVSIWWRHHVMALSPVFCTKSVIWTNAGILFIGPVEKQSVKTESKYNNFHIGKLLWKYRLWNGVHFVCCHWLNKCWLLISEHLWHLSENNLTVSVQANAPYNELIFEYYCHIFQRPMT